MSKQFSDEFSNKNYDVLPTNTKELEKTYALLDDPKKNQVQRPPTRMERKYTRMFGAAGNTSFLFAQGFKMGAAVGCGFGGVFGCYQAYATRNILVIPLAMIMSGGSFGFFMGLGMTFRSE